ncbi:hypothetical protein GCM10011617_28100 [Novosphingobium arvoryzae]|uniref:DUF1134 domain-containing protein n=2 Tax=Novosphingobium arvoryzae TaxID=1256514 RepID=A0A918RNK8_9SPHN|nr:hypothetical protein GCM10011617_28100 [Novosphingobium arvoryzae]
MTAGFGSALRGALLGMMGAAALFGGAPAVAQVQPVDPDKAIDADLAQPAAPAAAPAPVPATAAATPSVDVAPAATATTTATDPAMTPPPATTAPKPGTYKQDDLIGAAEGVFGKGAKGLAQMIEDLLKKQGEPNGYIVGREGGGALVVGLRYGSGTLHHKVEGQRPVYWTGPSIGFDAGANAGSTFVLVYNLYNTEDLYKRYPAGEGQAYLVGGFNASYLRRGDVVLIPIRMGAGLRLGVNAGYMKFSKKQKWLPF